jgi:hypothetical protein
MPGLVPGIHVLLPNHVKDVDGRDKPGHDEEALAVPMLSPCLGCGHRSPFHDRFKLVPGDRVGDGQVSAARER